MAACKLSILPSSLIHQDEVESLISIENEIRLLKAERDAIAQDLLARRLRGVPVEPGLYDLEVIERALPGRREHTLVVR